MARKPAESRDEKISRIARERLIALRDIGSGIGGGNENEPARFHHDMLTHIVYELAPRPHDELPYFDVFTESVMKPINRAFRKHWEARNRVLARMLRRYATVIADMHDH